MRYLAALMAIWAIPATALCAFLISVNHDADEQVLAVSLVSLVVGLPLALLLTVVVLPVMVVVEVSEARRRRKDRGPERHDGAGHA